jgi:serine protease Do
MPQSRVHPSTLAAIAAALAIGFGASQVTPIATTQAQTPPAKPATRAATPAKQAPASRALPDFSDLVEQYGPAVVNISTMGRRSAAQAQGNPFGAEPGDPLFEFFRRFQGPQGPGNPGVPDRPVQGLGSGFIVSPDGYIFTNAHVVADASEVTVRLTDKREFKAKVIGVDRRTDVALVKIEAGNLPIVKMGNPDNTKVGQWVAAIGSPFGLDHTVTAGIISAKSRSLSGESFVPFIQTDVALNPGNSGGPLFNMEGEVIGINSQIYSRTGGYMGLSFAIPIDVAMKIKDDLQKHGKVTRGRLGVSIQNVTPELAESFGLKKSQGALVSSVESGSPAEKAGLAPGDVILGINGRDIDQGSDLARLVADNKPGAKVTLKVWRKGQTRDIAASVGEAPAERVAKAEAPKGAATPQGKLGLAVRALSRDERRQLGSDGLVVESVSGPAARAGIQPGDAILALNDQPVKDVEQMRKLVDSAKGSIALLIQREDSKIYVPIKVG